jgi:hypothetical protein
VNELIQPGYLEWVGTAIRRLRPADNFVEIEVPPTIYLDREMLAAVFVDDGTAKIKIAPSDEYGQIETICGRIKDETLFSLLVKLFNDAGRDIPKTLPAAHP